MAKKTDSCLPLYLINLPDHRRIWAQIDPSIKLVDHELSDSELWTLMTAILMGYPDDLNDIKNTGTVDVLRLNQRFEQLPLEIRDELQLQVGKEFSFYKWRMSKELFVFDKDLIMALLENSEEIDVPVDSLLFAPYPVFYMKTSGWSTQMPCEIDGVIVVITTSGENEKTPTILFVWLYNDECYITQIYEVDGYYHCNENEERTQLINETLILLQYLCAINAEIQPSPTQKTIFRRDASVKDKYREIRQWDVGIRTGAALRGAREENSSAEERIINSGNGLPMKPHVRRAHWHHFWVGHRDDPDKRKLIVKWLPPIPVNVEITRDLPAVIHDVIDKTEES